MPQAQLILATAGHVDHGKTSLVYAITNKWCDYHSEELKRGITIKLGFADFTIRRCESCREPSSYTTLEQCPACGQPTRELRRISFLDAPGHETLMATMITASALVDGALLVIAANEPCPQPQTLEHLSVLEMSGIKNIVVIQNKIDLVTRQRAIANAREIRDFLSGTRYSEAPIIPTAALTRANIDALLQAIEKIFPTPQRDLASPPLMWVVRSFDANRPGTPWRKLVGGVVGGVLMRGQLSVGDEIELRPGIAKNGYTSLTTTIEGMRVEEEAITKAVPGGLFAAATALDPMHAKANGLVGNAIGLPGKLPGAINHALVEIQPVSRILERFSPIVVNETIVVSIGTATTLATVESIKSGIASLRFKRPVCAERGWRVAIMRRAKERWRVYGCGLILS